ncbi:hypothetical protein [Paenibacillus sp. 1P03SA]|uniref:hypothetical protein n=1 Tax=Paenibacillus sp. 1P03SA TaxID=3132294 RepID=UPI0039A38D15
MAVNIQEADVYIRFNCIDTEDWIDSDDERKTRLMNVAGRTLTRKYPKYRIPDNAVYEFANVLSVKFNDTFKNAQNGATGFSVAGISFQFQDVVKDLDRMIPQSVIDLIGEENGVRLRLRRIGKAVL